MPTITFITPDGEKVVVENAIGTLMETATEHEVDGIEAACGGVCACATCHVKVDPAWVKKLPEMQDDEKDMLELEDDADEVRSRLSCQVEITDDLDGLIVEVHPLR